VTVLSDDTGRSFCPSVVAYSQKGEALAGWETVNLLESENCQAVQSAKRVIGRNFPEVETIAAALPFKVHQDKEGKVNILLEGDRNTETRTVSPEEVSAAILRPLIGRAADVCGASVETAVITVPAHFGEAQRRATVRAGKLAGLKHVELLQEPIAAAMALGVGMDPEESDTVLVFDLGGGTFDVSILDSFEGIMEVLATGGDSFLGGDNWDEALIEWLASTAGDFDGGRELRALARSAKEALSTSEAVTIDIPAGGSGRQRVPLTRSEFEGLTEPLLRRLWPPMEQVASSVMLEWAGRPAWAAKSKLPTPADLIGSRTKGDLVDAVADKYAPPPRRVTRVVLAGAATQMPAVRRLISSASGVEPDLSVDPEHAVAIGAAIHAGLLTGEISRGIELMDGSYVSGQHGRASGIGSGGQL